MTLSNSRAAEHPVDRQFLERWSPRAFTQDTIAESVLLTFLEAARWAPSSYNSQKNCKNVKRRVRAIRSPHSTPKDSSSSDRGARLMHPAGCVARIA